MKPDFWLRLILSPILQISFDLFLKITSKRHLVDDITEYTVNDGLYGALNNVLYDKFPATLHPFCNSNGISYGDKDGKQLKLSRFWGPSCDGLDIITPEPIPFIEMEEGGWVYVPNAGAYVNPGAEFNGFPIADVYKVWFSIYVHVLQTKKIFFKIYMKINSSM